MKIGDYKSKESSSMNYDLSKIKQEGEAQVEPNTQEVKPEGVTPTEALEVSVQPEAPSDNSGVEPQTSSLEPRNDSTVVEQVEPQVKQPTIDDSSALSYLSERLGKEVKSFDELKEVKTVNPLDEDPYLKNLYEWRKKTGRSIEEYTRYQKDYSQVSDIDVAREILQHEYPTLTNEEINLELKKYVATEDDYDEDVQMKNLELKKLATRGRNVLKEFVSELGEPSNANLSPEVSESLKFAEDVKMQMKKQKEIQDKYISSIQQLSAKTDSLAVKLSDDLSINFNLSDDNKKNLPEMINTMPHWRNEDGSWNHQEVINDGIKISHFNDIVKLAYEQGLNAGKESLIKSTNNSTISNPSPSGSQPKDGSKGIKVDGLDEFFGRQKLSMRFGKK